MNHTLFGNLLICPQCSSDLDFINGEYACRNTNACSCRYPVKFNVPVMIACNNEVFDQHDFDSQAPPDIFFKTYSSPFVRLLKKIRPDVTLNYTSKKNYKALAEYYKDHPQLSILVVGGSIDGAGIRELKDHLPPNTILVESDVAHGPNTNIIFDSHQIPFKNASFDLVIVQAVLEHVLDPFTCVAEIHRVLKEGGTVYAETPFMQQVHGGQYDFHRFTYLGHRRLFRHFVEVNSGLVAGAGSSLAWSTKFFITSFASNKKADKVLSYISNFVAFWFKYADYFLNGTRGSLDAACGYYFRGTKQEGYTLPDRDLLKQYKGLRY